MFALLREIAHDDIRFPELKIAVLDGGNEPVRVQHTIFRCFGNAELVTGIDQIILQAEFAATPEHFLDVDGISSAPDLQHLDWSSLVHSRYEAASRPLTAPQSRGKLVRQHGRLANLRRCG